MSTDPGAHLLMGLALELHPQVALRPEPFGALAYHYGNRRLVFLKHPDMVTVARALGQHDTFAGTLRACGIDAARWPSFATAFASLLESHVVVERTGSERTGLEQAELERCPS